ncbi:MAG: hypothetical protein Fur007_08100 [Rhodoferax sp.]
MSTAPECDPGSVDVVFPLGGQSVLREHAVALRDALCTQWPELAHAPGAGIHPIRVVNGSSAQAMLSGRSRLLLRVPAALAPTLCTGQNTALQIGPDSVTLGAAHVRALLPHATLYAYHVATASEDEPAFMAEVDQTLARLGVRCERVCGQYHRRELSGETLHAYSLMLHALSPQDSLRVQQHGIGPHRLLGFGLFVPHKSAAAV